MKSVLTYIALSIIIATPAIANGNSQKLIPITESNYPTAETHRQMVIVQEKTGGINKFQHKRELTPTVNQPVVRMNRDTYYSMAVVNVSEGATYTVPEVPDGMYVSVQPVTEDHRIQAMTYGAGTFKVTTHTGNFVYLVVRLDSRLDKKDVVAIQDAMKINAGSSTPFSADRFDFDSIGKVENSLKAKMPEINERDGYAALNGMFTSPTDKSNDEFTLEKYQVGAAIGWGGAQTIDNVYEVSGNYPADTCHTATFENPKNKAFWSITVYDKAGFMFNDVANMNSHTAAQNANGSYTVSFGCGVNAINNIETKNPSGVFNLGVRHYMPSEQVRSGELRVLPTVTK
ncbi:DUF1254 domain-containing protein [Vibrio sp. DW001]|uniref:DUF1254 domain-containing protein n=1 Tax=Vibrio sp. DW001 TaxID=2912315 RepID=UPI0023B11B66|nr:DUF1254 domain-containing protein [Vibrio sp. DW001]WED27762.1 DUF1254 domain-containing protein [Vibrio sp. DW001]